MTQANTNDTLERVQATMAPKLAAHCDAFFLDDKLFRRVATLYARRDSLGLNAEQRFLVERYYKDFVRSGATLGASEKARLKTLNGEEATLTTAFQKKLLAATKAGALVIDDRRQLDGMSDAEIAAIAQDDKWVLKLQNTTHSPRKRRSRIAPCGSACSRRNATGRALRHGNQSGVATELEECAIVGREHGGAGVTGIIRERASSSAWLARFQRPCIYFVGLA